MAQQNSNCSSAEYRQFDFWIGDWEVKNAAGKTVGYNKIFPILDGCALSENWSNVSGNPGVSYNFYDQAKKQWHQTWIDNNGGALYLDGELINGSMVLSGQTVAADGANTTQRITWTPMQDGKVKQHWQSSTDEKNWTDVFVGFYQKRE